MAYKKIELEFTDVPFAFMITENVEIELVFSGIAIVVSDDDETALTETLKVKYTQDFQHNEENKHLESWTTLDGCIKDEFSKIKGFKEFWDNFETEMIEAAANYESDET